jgi:hypothetical protein
VDGRRFLVRVESTKLEFDIRYLGLVNTERAVAISSDEKYPEGRTSTISMRGEVEAGDSGFNNPRNEILAKQSTRKLGADPPVNESSTTGAIWS